MAEGYSRREILEKGAGVRHHQRARLVLDLDAEVTTRRRIARWCQSSAESM